MWVTTIAVLRFAAEGIPHHPQPSKSRRPGPPPQRTHFVPSNPPTHAVPSEPPSPQRTHPSQHPPDARPSLPSNPGPPPRRSSPLPSSLRRVSLVSPPAHPRPPPSPTCSARTASRHHVKHAPPPHSPLDPPPPPGPRPDTSRWIATSFGAPLAAAPCWACGGLMGMLVGATRGRRRASGACWATPLGTAVRSTGTSEWPAGRSERRGWGRWGLVAANAGGGSAGGVWRAGGGGMRKWVGGRTPPHPILHTGDGDGCGVPSGRGLASEAGLPSPHVLTQ